MRTLPTWRQMNMDTSPEIERLQFSLLREAPPWRKMKMLSGMEASARDLMFIRLSNEYPQAPKDEIPYLLADLLYGKEMGAYIRRGFQGATCMSDHHTGQTGMVSHGWGSLRAPMAGRVRCD